MKICFRLAQKNRFDILPQATTLGIFGKSLEESVGVGMIVAGLIGELSDVGDQNKQEDHSCFFGKWRDGNFSQKKIQKKQKHHCRHHKKKQNMQLQSDANPNPNHGRLPSCALLFRIQEYQHTQKE